MAEERWLDVGSAEDLSARAGHRRPRGHDADRARPPGRRLHRDLRRVQPRRRPARRGPPRRATTSSARGTTGSSTTAPARASRASRRTASRRYAIKVENGRVLVDARPRTPRHKAPHEPHPLARPVRREPGPVRVAGHLDHRHGPREPPLLGLGGAARPRDRARRGRRSAAETRLIRLGELSFRACEGYYSKSARACTWPCSITQMDPGDQLDRVYEALVHWADVVLVATPIRWGAASSLYYRMAERMNCIQNQVTTRDRVLIRDKVAGFIVIGGQDNVQAVAGQMLGFFAELGFLFPQFPYVAHSRGWTAEDMEKQRGRPADEPRAARGRRGPRRALRGARGAAPGLGARARARRPRRPQGPRARRATNRRRPEPA